MSHTFFLIIALVTTGIFLIQFVLSIFFGDLDADVDVDGICIWRETRKSKVTLSVFW